MTIRVFCIKSEYRRGPKVFKDRLRPVLKTFPEIKIVSDIRTKIDLEFAFIKSKYKFNKPMILRIDSCYYRKDQLDRNLPILKSIQKATHVVFQSNYSSKMVRKVLGVEPVSFSVIYNGIDMKWVDKIRPRTDILPGSFVACSSWRFRKNKRPLSMLNGFVAANTGKHLYMIGEYDPKWKTKFKKHNVHFMSQLSIDNVISIMKACSYMIHLCHIDSCPNAVIEGLACGLNILCTNLGGTREIVKDNGIVLDADPDWNFKPKKFMNLDNLNSEVVAEGINRIQKMKERPVRPDIDIRCVAKKYVDVFVKYGNC